MNHSPKVSNIFMLFLIFYLIIVNFSLGFIYASINIISSPINIILSHIVLFVPPLIVYLIVTKNTFSNTIKNYSLGITNIFFISLLTFLSLPFINLIALITNIFFPDNVTPFVNSISENSYITVILAIALTPAILEELMFRGIIFSGYYNVSIFKSSIIVGLFFGIMHLNLNQFFYAFAMGTLFTHFVHHTKSIKSSILSHFLVNAFSVTLAYTSKETTDYNVNTDFRLLDIVVSICFFLILLLLFIYIFKSFVNYNKRRNYQDNTKTAFTTKEVQAEKVVVFDIYFFMSIAIYIIFTILFEIIPKILA